MVAALSLNGSACDEEPLRACTLIGCDNHGLSIRLEGAVPAEYTLTLSAPVAMGGTVSRTCSVATPCASVLYFEAYAPDEVTLSLRWSAGERMTTVRPAYAVWYPNGPDCEPECRAATITVLLG